MKSAVTGVYQIRHDESGRHYIGSSQDCRGRKWAHWSALRNERHSNVHLQRAWKKYGEAAFSFRVLEICEIALLLEREQVYIDTLKPEFNIARDVVAPTRGLKFGPRHVTAVTREKLSQSHIGKSRAAGRSIGTANHTTPHSEETKRRISAAKNGKPAGTAIKGTPHRFIASEDDGLFLLEDGSGRIGMETLPVRKAA